jgi:hypothetical protein
MYPPISTEVSSLPSLGIILVRFQQSKPELPYNDTGINVTSSWKTELLFAASTRVSAQGVSVRAKQENKNKLKKLRGP